MPKSNLKDKLEGNELDLSLNNLDSLPIKDLAALPQATSLDLSCNLLDVLPDTFCTLTHLVKIDLSKNRLTSLPDDFGNLHKLTYVDLLGNKLTLLPVSLYQLTKLKWLDLKDNPLEPELKKVAGDCLDEKECKKCATDVVAYMKVMHGRLEKRRQKQLEEERKEREAREAEEEEERRKLQEERKKRKQEKKQAQKMKKQSSPEKKESRQESEPKSSKAKPAAKKQGGGRSCEQCCLSFFFWLFLTLGLVILAFTGLLVLCQNDPSNQLCEVMQYETTVVPTMKEHIVPHIEYCQDKAQKWSKQSYDYTVFGLEWMENKVGDFIEFTKAKTADAVKFIGPYTKVVVAFAKTQWKTSSDFFIDQYLSFTGEKERMEKEAE